MHNNLGVNPAIERNPDREHLGERVADLEIQTLVSDALSKNADLAEKHIATQVKSRTVALTGMVQTTNQKYTAEQIAWQVPGVQGLTNNLGVSDAQATPESADEKLARRVEFGTLLHESSSSEERADPRLERRRHSDRHGFIPCGKTFGGKVREIRGRRRRHCFSGLIFVIGRHVHALQKTSIHALGKFPPRPPQPPF